MQLIDENNADLMFKLETIVRDIVQEISEPMITKTKQAFEKIQVLIDISENHKSKHSGMQGHLSALELKLNFKSHEIDTMQQKFYELNNQVVFTAKQNSQLIQDMQFNMDSLNFKHRDNDDLVVMLHKKADQYSDQVQEIWTKLNEIQGTANEQLQTHQKDMYDQITVFKSLNTQIQESLSMTQAQSNQNKQFASVLSDEISRLKVQKDEINSCIKAIRTHQETLVPQDQFELFKRVYVTEVRSIHEIIEQRFKAMQENIDERHNNLLQQLAAINRKIATNFEQAMTEDQSIRSQVNDVQRDLRTAIAEESTNRATNDNALQEALTKLENDLEILNSNHAQTYFILKREGIRLKDYMQSNEARFITEQRIVDQKILQESATLKHAITDDLTNFTEQRCLEIVQSEIQQMKQTNTQQQPDTNSKDQEDTAQSPMAQTQSPVPQQNQSISYNPHKFKDYVDVKLAELTSTYFSESQVFLNILKQSIADNLQDEKQAISQEISDMKLMKTQVLEGIKVQDTKMQAMQAWLRDCESEIRRSLEQTKQNTQFVQDRTNDIERYPTLITMRIKDKLDYQMRHINQEQEQMNQKLIKTANQSLQTRSDNPFDLQETSGKYLTGQIQHLLREKQALQSKIDRLIHWLTSLTEGVNVALCTQLHDLSRCKESIAIPTFFDGILFQNYTKQDDSGVICYRMNMLQTQDLLQYTLLALQRIYSQLYQQLQLGQTCQELYKSMILSSIDNTQVSRKLNTDAVSKTTNTEGDEEPQIQLLMAHKKFIRKAMRTNQSEGLGTTSQDKSRFALDGSDTITPSNAMINSFNGNNSAQISPADHRIHSQSSQHSTRTSLKGPSQDHTIHPSIRNEHQRITILNYDHFIITMKNIFKTVKNLLKQLPDTTQETTFFKKVPSQQAQRGSGQIGDVVNRIEALDRIIVQGKQKDLLMMLIQQQVMQSKLGHKLSSNLVNACEIVHYGLQNDSPVLIKHIRTIEPQFDLQGQHIINEQEYAEKLRRESDPTIPNEDIIIENTYNMNDTEDPRRKNSQESWNIDVKNQTWRTKK